MFVFVICVYVYVSFFKSGIWRTMLIHVRVRAYDIDIDPNYTIDRSHTTWFIHGMGHESLATTWHSLIACRSASWSSAHATNIVMLVHWLDKLWRQNGLLSLVRACEVATWMYWDHYETSFLPTIVKCLSDRPNIPVFFWCMYTWGHVRYIFGDAMVAHIELHFLTLYISFETSGSSGGRSN